MQETWGTPWHESRPGMNLQVHLHNLDETVGVQVRFSPDGRFLVATGANQMSDELSMRSMIIHPKSYRR